MKALLDERISKMTSKERKEIESTIAILHKKIKDATLEENLEAIKAHKKFVGKCYKVEKESYYNFGKDSNTHTTYYKVISEVSENEYHVECLEFTLPLQYDYSSKSTMAHDNYPFSEIQCEPFVIRNEGLFCNDFRSKGKVINGLTEVTQEEFQLAMNDCYKQFVKFTNRTDLSNEVLIR